MSRKQSPEINAGSMADIAFLLLIFFLVTTTLNTDVGVAKKIPQKQKFPISKALNKKNVLEIYINKKNQLFANGNTIKISELKKVAIHFIDNGGGVDFNQKPCDWCEGEKNTTSSDHPSKAIISINSDRSTHYKTYIEVLDILNASYTILRNKLAVKLYHRNFESLVEDFKKSKYNNKSLQQKINTIKEKYPLLLLDTEIEH